MKIWQYKSQLLAVCTVNIISLSHGMALGWLSPVLPLLQSDDTPLESGPLTDHQMSWIGAFFSFGALFGTNFFSYLSHRFGRKFCLNFLGIPQILFCLFVIFGKTYYHLYLGRICAGFTGGGILTTISLYTADIAEPQIRGTFGTMTLLITNSGVLVSYIIGCFASYRIFPIIILPVPIIFSIIIASLPETPQSLVKLNKLEEAGISFRHYRGIKKGEIMSQTYSDDFAAILAKGQISPELKKLRFKDFSNKAAIKGLSTAIVLMIIVQFSGRFTFINYAAVIFRETGSSLGPNLSSIIMASFQIIGSYISTILVERTGRKFLLIMSLSGTTVSVFLLGGYGLFDFLGYDMKKLGLIPVVCITLGIFCGATGIFTLPFVVATEVLPGKIRTVGLNIAVSAFTISSFTVVKLFPILNIHIKLFGTFWLFTGVCCLGIVFIIFMVPETRNKNLNITDLKEQKEEVKLELEEQEMIEREEKEEKEERERTQQNAKQT